MSSAILAELILCPRVKGTLQIALPVNYGADHVVGNGGKFLGAGWLCSCFSLHSLIPLPKNGLVEMRVGEVKVKLGYEVDTIDI